MTIYREMGYYSEKLGTLTFEGASGAAQQIARSCSPRSVPHRPSAVSRPGGHRGRRFRPAGFRRCRREKRSRRKPCCSVPSRRRQPHGRARQRHRAERSSFTFSPAPTWEVKGDLAAIKDRAQSLPRILVERSAGRREEARGIILRAVAPSTLILTLVAATSIVLPKSATIVDSKESFGREPIGNVKVTFTDGHAEMWTRLGKCDMAKVSISGLVGWARYEFRGYRNCPILNTLRVCWPDGHHLDFEASGTYPFIEEWNFADDNSAVVIESRRPHVRRSIRSKRRRVRRVKECTFCQWWPPGTNPRRHDDDMIVA